MSSIRAKFIVAVHVLVEHEEHLLLLERCNTGYCDGMYSVPAGHVETGETVIAAAQRELLEETGLAVDTDAFELVHMMSRRKLDEHEDRIDFFFRVSQWSGEPTNAEPEKCSQLQWVPVQAVERCAVVPYITAALAAIAAGEQYSWFTEP